MMGPQAVSEQAGQLLAIIADSAKYKEQVKTLEDLAKVAKAEADKNAQTLESLGITQKQITADREAIEKTAAKAAADNREAQAARESAASTLAAARSSETRTKELVNSTGAQQAERTRELDALANTIAQKKSELDEREAALAKREAALAKATDDFASKMARLQEVVGA